CVRAIARVVGQSASAVLGVGHSRGTMRVQIREVLEAEGVVIDSDCTADGAREESPVGSRGLWPIGTKLLPLQNGEIDQLARSRKPVARSTAPAGTGERREHQDSGPR